MPKNELAEKVLALALELIQAVGDGKVDVMEALSLLASVNDVLGNKAELADAMEWVRDLLHRDAAELEAKAVKLDAKGKSDRAAKLRAKAATRT